MKYQTPSICIRLKYGGSYDSLQNYFDRKEYFEDEKGIFVCLNLFELDYEDYNTLKTWLMTYGLMGTFKLKKLPDQKTKIWLF